MKRLILLLMLAGCAPKCQKASFWDGGYEDFKVNDHEYVVTFKEGTVKGLMSQTPSVERDRIIALRAAELTLQNGFTHFDMKRDKAAHVMHIYCYDKEETETAIDALALSERISNNPPHKEKEVIIAVQGDV